jgi:pimeloyl-ACP methyl ester carboxylesterase
MSLQLYPRDMPRTTRARRALLATTACAAVLALAASCGTTGLPRTEARLTTRDGLACQAYLVSGRQPVTDVFLVMGGTGTSTSARLPAEFQELLASRSAAFVTFDKPGVHATFGDPSSVQIEDDPFQRHTQATLLDCARSALALALDRFGPATRWHLRGHSEGALLALFLLDDLLDTDPAMARRVKTLILSGLPLEPFAEIIRRQLADHPALARAIESCDWAVMRTQGVSCAYLRHAAQQPSGQAMFERLAARSPAISIQVFQGNDDVHTPARFVHALEAWNAAQGHMDLSVRYYDGAHGGSSAARRELGQLLLDLVPSHVE